MGTQGITEKGILKEWLRSKCEAPESFLGNARAEFVLGKLVGVGTLSFLSHGHPTTRSPT